MTERERVLSILKHEKPDRLPWMADLDYWVFAQKTDHAFPAVYTEGNRDEGIQRMHRDLGAGFYLQGYEPFRPVYRDMDYRVEEKVDIRTTTITTPVGVLREVAHFSRVSYSYGIMEHLVKDIDDLKIFTYFCEHLSFEPNYELARRRYQTIGDNGVVLCYMPKSPLMDLVALRSGVENVTYMAADDPEEFGALLRCLEEKYDEACQLALDSPAECIMIPENISSECVASFYQDYMKGYHKKWTTRIRDAGKYSFVHQDGTTRGLVAELSKESGFDVIEAVTPLPVGDVTIEEAAAMTDERTVIWGGIPGGMFVEESTDDDTFEQHVKHCIEVMKTSPRFVLGVADQVVPGSSRQRIMQVRKLVDQYGNF